MDVFRPDQQQPEFFAHYLKEAAKWLSVVDLKHRGAAIERSKRPLVSLDGEAMVKELCATLDGPWWQGEKSARGRNWVWRDTVPPHLTESKEVVLERRLAQRSSERWTCQMSTSSGLRPGVRDSRRSIDIVHHIQEDEYRFIELKVGSDQPLYAMFEVLGYGLLYLLARQHGRRGGGRHDVMAASRIELLVLGPDRWFNYRDSPAGPISRFGFEWIQNRINEGLAAEMRTRGCDGPKEMSLSFGAFVDTSSVEDEVAAIDALFSPEVRTHNPVAGTASPHGQREDRACRSRDLPRRQECPPAAFLVSTARDGFHDFMVSSGAVISAARRRHVAMARDASRRS